MTNLNEGWKIKNKLITNSHLDDFIFQIPDNDACKNFIKNVYNPILLILPDRIDDLIQQNIHVLPNIEEIIENIYPDIPVLDIISIIDEKSRSEEDIQNIVMDTIINDVEEEIQKFIREKNEKEFLSNRGL